MLLAYAKLVSQPIIEVVSGSTNLNEYLYDDGSFESGIEIGADIAPDPNSNVTQITTVSGSTSFQINPSPGDKYGDLVTIYRLEDLYASGFAYSGNASVSGSLIGSFSFVYGKDVNGKGLFGSPFTISKDEYVTAKVGDIISFPISMNLKEIPPFRNSFNNFFYFDYKAFVLVYPKNPDLIASVPSWSTSDGGVDFGYSISNANLTQPPALALYWASGTTPGMILGGPIVTPTATKTAQGASESFHVTRTQLGIPPQGAKYLLAVVDPKNVVTETDETNNVSAVAIPDSPTVELLLPDHPVMGQDYDFRVRLTNPSFVPTTLTLDWSEFYVGTVPFNESRGASTQVIALGPGETRIISLGTFNHQWMWLPDNPPTIPQEVKDQLFSVMAPGLSGLLSELLNILPKVKTKIGIDKIISFADTLNTQLDIASLLADVHSTNTINYFIKVSDALGTVYFSKTTPVIIGATQDQLDHLRKHIIYFILAERFQTGIPALDFALVNIFQGLAQNEYRLAKRTK